MYYIEETDKPNFIYKKLSILKLEDNKIILPITGKEDITNKQAEKLGQKTKKILEKTNCKKVILSKKIQKYEQYLNELYSYNFEIVNGKWLYEVLLYKILYTITKQQNLKKEETRNNNSSKRNNRKHIRKYKKNSKKL